MLTSSTVQIILWPETLAGLCTTATPAKHPDSSRRETDQEVLWLYPLTSRFKNLLFPWIWASCCNMMMQLASLITAQYIETCACGELEDECSMEAFDCRSRQAQLWHTLSLPNTSPPSVQWGGRRLVQCIVDWSGPCIASPAASIHFHHPAQSFTTHFCSLTFFSDCTPTAPSDFSLQQGHVYIILWDTIA